MAKRNKIPESILTAPELRPVPIVEHKGMSRAQRRRLNKRLRGTNVPYRKAAT